MSPTQELMACILTRQTRKNRQSNARKNRTRKKSAVEEDHEKTGWKMTQENSVKKSHSPEKNKKNEPFE